MGVADAPPRERRLKRSNTAPKKQETGGIMGLIGSFRKSTRPEMPERKKSRSYRDDDGRYATETERETARKLRRDDRRRGSVRPDTDAEGFMTDAAGGVGGADTEAEEAEARRAARKAKRASRQAPSDARESARENAREIARENEAREAEERRARRKERAREQRAREEEEEERRQEEKRARRAAREERRAREEQAAREAEAAAEAKAAERRERRRMCEEEMLAAKASRRRSRVEERFPDEVLPDEREVIDRRGGRSSRAPEDPKARRRKSKAAPEPESTRPTPMKPGAGKNKTSSWVYSQADEPPEPPPIMPTVIDMPPAGATNEAGNGHSLSSDEEARRAVRRKARHRAKYPDDEVDDTRSRRRGSRREGVKSSSGSGDYERDRGMRSQPGSRQGAPASSAAKGKSSWFRKLTTF